MTETFYDLLGIPADAEPPEIERAYRQRIKETHPDLNDAPDASERTARLVKARDVLTDAAERARYDRLGHDAYVGGDFSAPTDPDASTDPAAYGGARAAAEAARRDSEDGPTNARAGAEERRRRERQARRDVDFGAADESSRTTGGTAGDRGSESATSGDAPNGGATAGATDGTATNGGTATTGSAVGADGARHRTTASAKAPSWSDTSQGWAARTPASPEPGLVDLVRNAMREAPGTAIITFVLYPLLVLGAFFPPFPLVVNVIVAVCLFAMIGAVQSVPGLGVAIYGGWTVLASLGLIIAAGDPLAPFWLVVLGTTWLPLGFSILTSRVLDP